ncbi:MAG TPA: PadR family transcriptional regulator [Feifaniaceae bacterium]|nr:PadR family transcriptional regulator [Feifaniaceae bacterium]
MAKENTTRFIVLGLLSHEDMSGYDMKKRMDLSVSHFWNVGFGQIYPTLKELSAEGLVQKKECPSAKGPNKIVYSITQKGREALLGWLQLPEEKEYTRYELLLKLFFSASLPAEYSLRRIAAFQARHEQNLHLMEQFTGELKPILDAGPDHTYYYLTALFGKHVYQAYLAWAKEAQAMLEQIEG